MRTRLTHALIALATVASCDMGKITVNTTAKVLVRAQPSLQMESDYELASRAIPGALKTIEGFWIVNPDNQDLTNILTEGYCQYGTAFVEDDWEIAKDAQKPDDVAYHNARASNMFTRCLNYALKTLGSRWQKEIFGTTEVATKLIHDTGASQRDSLMWAALALGSLINHNLTHVEMLAYIPTVRMMLDRVIELDKAKPPSNKVYAGLPHIAIGMLLSAASTQFGGDPKRATEEFQAALAATATKDYPDGRMLLARVLWGYRVGLQTNDRKVFHDQLVKVLETPGSVWPEQRLANEVAHRRARRYLSREKQLFQ
jgi:hypothetical protein